MSRILVVEDSRFFSNVIEKTIARELDVEVVVASSLEEAERFVADGDFFLSLLDLALPDAPDGEVVDFVISKGIPCIVFSGMYSDDLRERILSKNVIDYVVKESPASLSYLISLVRRIERNRRIKAMVVDDSTTARKYVGDLLNHYQFQVLAAANGREALTLLQENPDIKLIVTDYFMPEMDGFELIKNVRRRYSKDELAIIGVSSAGGNTLSAKFIKVGANDFINKPFLREEFFCRISQNMDTVEYIAALKEAATIDPLTGLFNRRVLFDVGPNFFAGSMRKKTDLAVAMVDVDYFKAVNDQFGHHAGDEVLKNLASILSGLTRQCDLAVRIGGEEFCLLFVDMDEAHLERHLEKIRLAVESTPCLVGGETIWITVSIGATRHRHDSLESMIADADKMLYKAKRSGRNQVVVAPDAES
jgi:diguanylate cyclase (GGDEF)-like protein